MRSIFEAKYQKTRKTLERYTNTKFLIDIEGNEWENITGDRVSIFDTEDALFTEFGLISLLLLNYYNYYHHYHCLLFGIIFVAKADMLKSPLCERRNINKKKLPQNFPWVERSLICQYTRRRTTVVGKF